MIVAFCIPQFKQENFPLQPWLTIHRVAMGLVARHHQVHVISDVRPTGEKNGIQLHGVDSLRGTNSKQIEKLLQNIEPNYVVVTVTPLSLVTAGWYQFLKRYTAYAYLSYPFYTKKQIFRALPHIGKKDRWEYGRHLLVPRRAWSARLVRFFNAAICQSTHTAEKVKSMVKSMLPVHVILPGIDIGQWASEIDSEINGSNNFFLFLGSTSQIRGFRLLLDAFALLSDKNIQLEVLARGADEPELADIKKCIVRQQLQECITVQGGWMKINELKKKIQSATAVLFPFILVPSELPVSVLETIYCGTPVIVSDIAGLAEVAGNAGIVVPQANVGKMASAIQKLYRQKELQTELKACCSEQRKEILSWDIVCEQWANHFTQ